MNIALRPTQEQLKQARSITVDYQTDRWYMVELWDSTDPASRKSLYKAPWNVWELPKVMEWYAEAQLQEEEV